MNPTAKKSGQRRRRGLGPISLYLAPLLMGVFGAYLAITTTDAVREAYVRRLIGGLVFAVVPIAAAVILVVGLKLLRRLFRS